MATEITLSVLSKWPDPYFRVSLPRRGLEDGRLTFCRSGPGPFLERDGCFSQHLHCYHGARKRGEHGESSLSTLLHRRSLSRIFSINGISCVIPRAPAKCPHISCPSPSLIMPRPLLHKNHPPNHNPRSSSTTPQTFGIPSNSKLRSSAFRSSKMVSVEGWVDCHCCLCVSFIHSSCLLNLTFSPLFRSALHIAYPTY